MTVDEQYSDAILSGNIDLGRDIAMQYAKSQGYCIPAYHGTCYKFDEFNIGDIGFHFSQSKCVAVNRMDDKISEIMFKQSEYPNNFIQDGVVLNVALSIHKPLYLNSDMASWTAKDIFNSAAYKITDIPFVSPTEMYVSEQKRVANCAYKLLTISGYTDDDILHTVNDLQCDFQSIVNSEHTEILKSNIMENTTYDGIVYVNEYEADDSEEQKQSYIVFKPSQIKSIDPIYDDNGVLIPLSQRFKPNSPKFIN